ncbi:MAG: response regulator transcription factor [Bacteroidia bacterium]|nr:response regulator transcription factor [Bacteroidia bacterium]
MPNPKHIYLVDDHVIIRNGLQELVEKLGPYKVTHQFDNGRDLLDSLASGKRPDLIIMDQSMPQMNGHEVMQNFREKGIQVPVLMLTLNEDEDLIIQLFRLGVRGYLKKNCNASQLGSAIEHIVSSGYYHNEFLTLSLQNNAVENKKGEQDLILEQLTAREKEFLRLVCHEKEYTYEQIADKMGVQHRTVDGYREAIFEKFRIKSKTGLVLFVLKHRLFDLL